MYSSDGGGILVTVASEAVINNCEVWSAYPALYVESWSHASGSGNIFAGGSLDNGTIRISSASTVSFHGCHILRDNCYAVRLSTFLYDPLVQDLTNNYWGTTDPDSVAVWIWDGHDAPAIHSTVEYLPIADGPLPADSKSWGEVKALYR